jgi:hypothetical protein
VAALHAAGPADVQPLAGVGPGEDVQVGALVTLDLRDPDHPARAHLERPAGAGFENVLHDRGTPGRSRTARRRGPGGFVGRGVGQSSPDEIVDGAEVRVPVDDRLEEGALLMVEPERGHRASRGRRP